MADLEEPMFSTSVLNDTEYVTQVLKAARMPAIDAYKAMHGGEEPDRGLWPFKPPSRYWKNFSETHSSLQKALMNSALQEGISPAYGKNVEYGAKLIGVKPEEFATPDQVRSVPQSMQVENSLVPSTFDIDHLQPSRPHTPWIPAMEGFEQNKGLTPEQIYSEIPMDSIVTPPTLSRPGVKAGMIPAQDQDIFSRSMRTLDLPPKKEVDLEAPMDASQRQLVDAYLKRQESPWSMRAQQPNAATIKSQSGEKYLAALEAYGPEDPRTITLGVQAGVLKSTAQSGSVESRLSTARADRTEADAKLKQEEYAHAHEMWDAKTRDIESRIMARTKNATLAANSQASLHRLRQSQAAINEAKLRGDLPEQQLAQMKAEHQENQRRFLRAYLGSWDPKDLLTPEGQDAAAQELMEILGLDMGAAKSQVGPFRQLGQSMGIIEKPQVERLPQPQGKVQRRLVAPKDKPTDTRKVPAPAAPTPAQDEAKELEAELGDKIKQYEGKTFNGGKYMIQGGKVVVVK